MQKTRPGSHCNRGAEYGKVSAESDSEFFAEACNLRRGVLVAAFIVGCCCHGVVYFEIELDFRFCSGRSDAHFGAVGSEILQHIGGRGEVHLGHFAGAAVSYIKVGVVLDEHNIGAIEFFGRIGTEILHHFLDFLSARFAGAHYRNTFFVAIAVLEV